MARVTFRSATTDARTAAMLTEVEKIVGRRLRIAQGSYSARVSASASTHKGGGAVDVATKYQSLSRRQKLDTVAALRRVGFAAWLREETPVVWGEHIHCIAIGCPDLSASAEHQVEAYHRGRDGLLGNRPDPQSSLGVKPTTWEAYLQSKKPSRGRATITALRGAWSRREPSPTARGVRHRKVGESFTYVAVRVVDGITWLRTPAGNWIRSAKTSRGA